jgi:VanZ family protein
MAVLRPALRHGPAWFVLGLLIVAGIVAGSLLPSSDLPDLRLWDKFEHAFSYALLSFWYGSIVGRRALPLTFVAMLAFGGAMELLQGGMHLGRTADMMDMAANTTGILIGLGLSQTPLGSWAQRFESLFVTRPST